jgi:diguanylate cyclase
MQMQTSSAWESFYVMSDIILARVSETLATEQSLESLVRQLLEMLEIVTDMESTYLTKVDIRAAAAYPLCPQQQADDDPGGAERPWDETLCKRALDSDTMFSNDVPERWPSAKRRKLSALPLHEYSCPSCRWFALRNALRHQHGQKAAQRAR